MAKTGVQWVSLFSEMNSGTNNAQYMVLDYSIFTPGNPLKSGTFHVVEQIPGLIVKEDMTQHLQNVGFWASYNRPYFPQVRGETGHDA